MLIHSIFYLKKRDRFIQLITQVADYPHSPLAIVTTMRADFLEPCLGRVRQPKGVILSLAGDNLEQQKTLKELIDGKQGLVKGRLLVTGESKQGGEAWVDLAHEALIEGWTQLNDWRTENREGRKLARQMENDAQNWSHHKSPDYLWRGDKLAEAEKVLSEYAATVPLSMLLSKQAQEFLEECRKLQLRLFLSSNVDSLE